MQRQLLVLSGSAFVLGLVIGAAFVGSAMSREPAHQASVPENTRSREPAAIWKRTGNTDIRHAAEVIRTIDGDTFEARVHLWPGLDMTTRVRLRGIDAPELKAACADELKMAQAASDALQVMLAEGDVTIFNIGPDKYNGRVVADASTRQTANVSAALLAAGHARTYQGGRRFGWCVSASR